MISIYRNLIRVLRRYRLAVVLNILGLSVAFAAFMVIMVQVYYDFSFDRFHKDYDKIFRVELSRNSSVEAHHSRPFADQFINSSPHILVGALQLSNQNANFYIEKENGERHSYNEKISVVSPSFFNVFTFEFVEGSNKDLEPGNVFIPLSLARKFFGNESAVDRQIFHTGWGLQTVKAVYRDFPINSSIENRLYYALRENENIQSWNDFNYFTYIRVNNPSNQSLIIDNFKRNFKPPEDKRALYDWEIADIRLTALKDLHFTTDVKNDYTPKGSKQTLMILFAIAIAIISIAGINFTNFSVSLAPKRIKIINMQHIFGAGRILQRISIIFEAVFFSLLAYLIAILFFVWFNSTPLTKLFSADLYFVGARPLIVGGTALIALLVGLFSGLYPARYMTSFKPALVSKGSFGLSPKGRKLRSILLGIQFFSSCTLIIIASFMYLQNHFMQKSPLGYDKDEIITVNIEPMQNQRELFINQLKAYSGIEDVTYGQNLLSNSDRQYSRTSKWYNEKSLTFVLIGVHYNFLKVMGIEITEGRDFNFEDATKLDGVLVFNEAAKKTVNLELNISLDGLGEIIGFISDVKFDSFHQKVDPMAFCVYYERNGPKFPFGWQNQIYIKQRAGRNKHVVMSHVRAVIDELAPNSQIEPFFMMKSCSGCMKRKDRKIY